MTGLGRGTVSRVRVVIVVASLVLAAGLAVGLAVLGTTLGARLHAEPGFGYHESSAYDYSRYGWPWAWKTNAPEPVIETLNANSEEGRWWNEDGYAPVIFFWTTAMWFAAALAGEALLGAAAYLLWRLFRHPADRLRRSRSSGGLSQ